MICSSLFDIIQAIIVFILMNKSKNVNGLISRGHLSVDKVKYDFLSKSR
jgi:hypothetical protein